MISSQLSDYAFSVIVPVFNRENLIKRTIQSVLDQKYQNFELVVVDDGSTDHTQEVISEILDPRVRYHYQNNAERGAARNSGIRLATGDYITFLDSDDLLYPNHLSEAVRMIEQYDEPEFFHLAYQICDGYGKVLRRMHDRSGDLNQSLVEGNLLSCLGVFIRKDVIDRHMFNESRELSGSEDWELWMRLASRYKLYYSNEVTAGLVQHPGRSVLRFDQDRLVRRIELVGELLSDDPEFLKTYGEYLPKMKAHLSLYLALHLAIGGQKTKAWYYLRQAVGKFPSVLSSRKVASVLLKIISPGKS